MGIWKTLVHQPGFQASTMLLLTDGTVMCADEGPALGGSPRWQKLTPDNKGNYLQGTWSALANSPTAPLYFASAVLRNGRVFVAGGEYQDGLNWDLLAAQVYNPASNVWSVASLPPGWTNIGDSPSCVLPDGRVLVGSIQTNKTAIYNPDNNTWVAGADKLNPSSSEETWTLLPDETILSVDCLGHPGAEKYVIAANLWVPIPATPADLVEASSIEIGPAILLPNGHVFCMGATGHTAFYKMPPIASQLGAWSAGPDFPPQPGHPVIGAKDAPACLLPNGNILCVAGPVDGISDDYLAPMFFFEFEPGTGAFNPVANPPTNPANIPPFAARFLLLPNGEVLFSNGTTNISVYEPTGGPAAAWLPAIASIRDSAGNPVTNLAAGAGFELVGTQLNGLSQAVSYGDDAQMATNYPLVRIQSKATGDVVYCRTQDHSSMGVATGNTVQSTQFVIPSGTGLGSATLQVVANGLGSSPVAVTIV